jgi:hypothetical protein
VRRQVVRSLVGVVISCSFVVATSSAHAVTCDGSLAQVALPVPGDSALYQDVAALSASRAWVVGSVTPTGSDQTRGIVSRWNGEVWREVGPFVRAGRFAPRSVGVLSPSSVWVAGRAKLSAGGDNGSMVQFFDGSTWSIEASFPFSGGFLHEVAAIASDDVWVAGDRNGGGTGRAITYHFDGLGWTKFRTPVPASATSLEILDLEARAPDDVWMVGTFTTEGGEERSLGYRFRGSGWQRITTPNPGAETTILSGVEPIGEDDVVVVGSADGSTLALRWDGASWTRMSSESPGTNDAFNDVAMVDANDLWAGGSTSVGGFPPSSASLAARWTGSAWAAVPAPSPNGTIVLLGEVAATSTGAVYMLGLNLSRKPFMAQRCI